MAEAIRKRNEIEDRYKWDLTHIYASDEAWEKDYEEVMELAGSFGELDGHVAENPKKAIKEVNNLYERIHHPTRRYLHFLPSQASPLAHL